MYPGGDVPNGGGDLQPVTFPVFDGTALSGNNAHVFADVNDDDVAAPKDEVPALTGTDWSGYLPRVRHDGRVPELLDALLLHMGQDRREGLEPEPQLVRRPALLLPQHVPRSPAGGADRVHRGGRQLPGARTRAGRGSAATPSRGTSSTGANTANGFPDGGHINNANFSDAARRRARRDADVPAAGRDLGAEHPVRRLGQRGRDRVPRVHARVVQPAGHDARRHPGAERAAVGRDGRGLERLVRDRLHRQPRLVLRHAGERRRDRVPLLRRRRSVVPHAAVDCPVGVAAANCPVDGFGSGPGGYTYADYGKIVGRPEVHADGEIWAADAVGDARAARVRP